VPNEIWIPTMMIRVGYRHCDGFQRACTILSLMGATKEKLVMFVVRLIGFVVSDAELKTTKAQRHTRCCPW
jgi:hypothetical protein